MSPAASGGDGPAGGSWFEQLEAKLDQQLEAFLRANPAQQELLREQEQQERRQRLGHRRLELQQQAQALRAELLELAGSIQAWQGRSERARQAGALDLATRAEAHCAALMERGRGRWQQLEGLGREFSELEASLRQASGSAAQAAAGQAPSTAGTAAAEPECSAPSPEELDRSWARFEAEQELEELRRRKR